MKFKLINGRHRIINNIDYIRTKPLGNGVIELEVWPVGEEGLFSVFYEVPVDAEEFLRCWRAKSSLFGFLTQMDIESILRSAAEKRKAPAD